MQSELLVEALLIFFSIAKVLRGFLESGAEPRLFSDQVEDLGFARIYRPETIGGRERIFSPNFFPLFLGKMNRFVAFIDPFGLVVHAGYVVSDAGVQQIDFCGMSFERRSDW